jgi:hypothetical protein
MGIMAELDAIAMSVIGERRSRAMSGASPAR